MVVNVDAWHDLVHVGAWGGSPDVMHVGAWDGSLVAVVDTCSGLVWQEPNARELQKTNFGGFVGRLQSLQPSR